jgi:CubicO group peptidase (beta-lactamase class C family)
MHAHDAMKKPILLVAAIAALTALAAAQSGAPSTAWERIDTPASVGFSAKRLEALRAWVSSLDTTAMMVVVGGRALFTHGDVKHVSYLASGRKSVLALLYGNYVENGTIPLDDTLAALKMTDVGGLLPREQGARVQHLLTARSGVYHAPSNGGDDSSHAPPRGSVAPGTRFLYNNWDFNAAGAVFEKLTGRDIYDALETDLARPLGMEDFDRARQRKSGAAETSSYPAYHVWLSTRDMARLGELALCNGSWNGRQVVPGAWIARITSLVTPFGEMNQSFEGSPPTVNRWGYGYLWWVYDALSASDPFAGAFTAWGVGGQYITVMPKLEMVVAHKVDTGFGQGPATSSRSKSVSPLQYDVLLRMLAAAKCADRDRCE